MAGVPLLRSADLVNTQQLCSFLSGCVVTVCTHRRLVQAVSFLQTSQQSTLSMADTVQVFISSTSGSKKVRCLY